MQSSKIKHRIKLMDCCWLAYKINVMHLELASFLLFSVYAFNWNCVYFYFLFFFKTQKNNYSKMKQICYFAFHFNINIFTFVCWPANQPALAWNFSFCWKQTFIAFDFFFSIPFWCNTIFNILSKTLSDTERNTRNGWTKKAKQTSINLKV